MSELRDAIAAAAAGGLSQNEIARRLGIAGPTVAYHLSRLEHKAPRGEPEATPGPPSARQEIDTRQQVAALITEGLSRAEIARILGVTRSTVSYHARRLGEPIDARCARRYDWEEVQRYYEAGHSVRDCQERFGFSRESWSSAVKRGDVVARPAHLPFDELLVAGTYRSRHNLKNRLLKSGMKRNQCELCGLRDWLGKPVSLALHHCNGDRHDNRLENLKLLCPNCHSQTDTFSGRNRQRPRDKAPE